MGLTPCEFQPLVSIALQFGSLSHSCAQSVCDFTPLDSYRSALPPLQQPLNKKLYPDASHRKKTCFSDREYLLIILPERITTENLISFTNEVFQSLTKL